MLPNDTTPEEWRPVVGYEGWYSVSNLGRVRRERAYRNTWPGRILRAGRITAGYLAVSLYRDNAHRMVAIHVLVAEAFLPPCVIVGRREVNHLDGTKTNNVATNLEWCTSRENKQHASRMGLLPTGDRNGSRRHPERRGMLLHPERHWARTQREAVGRKIAETMRLHPERWPRGERHPDAKLTEADVRLARCLAQDGWSPGAIGRRMGVSRGTIRGLLAGKSWKHVV